MAARLILTACLLAGATGCTGSDGSDRQPSSRPADNPAPAQPSGAPTAPPEALDHVVPEAITSRPTRTWRIPLPEPDPRSMADATALPVGPVTVVTDGGGLAVLDRRGRTSRRIRVPGGRLHGVELHPAPGLPGRFLVRSRRLMLFTTTGRRVWTQLPHCDPALYGPGHVLAACEHGLAWIDLATGRATWRSGPEALVDDAQRQVFGQTLYTADAGTVTITDLGSGEERVVTPERGVVHGVSPTLVVTRGDDGRSPLTPGTEGPATAYDPATGEQLWQEQASNVIGVVGDTTVLVSPDGWDLWVVDRSGEAIGEFAAPDGPVGWHQVIAGAGRPLIEAGAYVHDLTGAGLFGGTPVGMQVSDGWYVAHRGRLRHYDVSDEGVRTAWTLPFPGQWARYCPEPRGIPRGTASQFNCTYRPGVPFTTVTADDGSMVWVTDREVIRWD